MRSLVHWSSLYIKFYHEKNKWKMNSSSDPKIWILHSTGHMFLNFYTTGQSFYVTNWKTLNCLAFWLSIQTATRIWFYIVLSTCICLWLQTESMGIKLQIIVFTFLCHGDLRWGMFSKSFSQATRACNLECFTCC